MASRMAHGYNTRRAAKRAALCQTTVEETYPSTSAVGGSSRASRGGRRSADADADAVRQAEAVKQLLSLEKQITKLKAAVLPTADNLATLARIHAALQATLRTAAPTPSHLLRLPCELSAAIGHLADASPNLRLTCKALHTALPAQHLRPIQSPDQTDAAFTAALHRPSRLALLTSLHLSDTALDLGSVHTTAELVAKHCTALRSLALRSLALHDRAPPLECLAPACAASLKRVTLAADVYSASGLRPLSHLTSLCSLSLSLEPYLELADFGTAQEAAALLWAPIVTLTTLTRLDLSLPPHLHMAAEGIPAPAFTAAALPLIAPALPRLAHLSLLPAAPWDAAALAHLATLTALTALAIGLAPSPPGTPTPPDTVTPESLACTLAALPHLATLALHIPYGLADCARLLPRPAPSALRSLSLIEEEPPGLLFTADNNAAFRQIAQYLATTPPLTHLALTARIKPREQDLQLLFASVHSLQSLHIEALTDVPNTLCTHLATLSHLTSLTVLSCRVRSSTAATAEPLDELQKLHSLTTDVSKKCGLELIGRLTSLTSLELHGLQAGGVQQLEHLLGLKRLQQLQFCEALRPYDFSMDDPAVCSVLMQLPALQRCMHPSFGRDMACSADDFRRRFAAKTMTDGIA